MGTRAVLAATAGCLILTLTGIAVGLDANDPRAEDFQGNFLVSNPNYPTPTSCGFNWKEVRNQTYVGTITSSTTPELNNKKMVLDSFYLGGGGGSGVAFATASVYTRGLSDILVARGPLSIATNGYVPPENAASGNGYMELTFYDRGQPTPRRTIAMVNLTIFGVEIHAAIGGNVGDKSVIWNGETCPE